MAASRLRRVIFRDPITLRSHLTVLVLVTIIPLIIFSGLMIYLLGSRERDTFERGATERTLAVLTAVDTELKSSITTLEALAALRHFDKNDIQSFREDAARVLKIRCLRPSLRLSGIRQVGPRQLASVTGKQVREMKFDVELANSQVLNLMVNAAPLFDEQGNVRGAVGAHVDITRLKQAEAALKKFNEDLEKLVADRTEGLMQLNARWSIASPSVRSSKTNCASRKRWKRWARLPPAWRMISTIFFTSFRRTLPC